MFDPKSRYYSVRKLTVRDARGRLVTVVPPAAPPQEPLLGVHLRKQGERPDHLAARYVSDPAGYWRLAEANDVMTADALGGLAEVKIPAKGGSR